jgi:hypothetical protein
VPAGLPDAGTPWTQAREFTHNVAWALGGAAQRGLAWNLLIGDGEYALHVDALHWGYNARQHSGVYLAAEFCQATVDVPISDRQVATLAEAWRREVAPVWPELGPATMELPLHSELAAGIADLKSDAYPRGDLRGVRLRNAVRAALIMI